MSPVAASALAAAFAGLADALVTVAVNPDPAQTSLRLGYALGPILVDLSFLLPVGLLAAVITGWRRAGAARIAVATILGLWVAGVGMEGARSGHGAAGLAILVGASALAAVALGRLACDLAGALARYGRRVRRACGLAAAVALGAGALAIAPAGLESLRAGTGPCPSDGSPVPPGPNVLLVTIDALRADAAAAMGSYKRLAARGYEFRQHVTTSPWTLPSLASLLTGLPPAEHGAGVSLSSASLLAKTPVSPSAVPLAARLGAAGYRTHAVVTNPFLAARYGIDHGFCSFENVSMEGEAVRGLEQTTLVRFVRALAPRLLPSDRADVVAARAAAWLDRPPDRPFFLWIHLLDPHAPYGDRDGASTSLTLDLMAFQEERGWVAPFSAVGRLRAGELRPTVEERDRIEGLYLEDVAFADRHLGRLLDQLDASGLGDRTAVVLTADHGEEFWEHGGTEHGRTLYEEVMRVPLVIVPPGGLASAQVRTELTSVLDVAPTLAELARLGPSPWRGRSLLEPPPDRALPMENLLFGEERRGVRTPHHKYVVADHGEERLFDLERDPHERVDLAGAGSGALADGRALLASPLPVDVLGP